MLRMESRRPVECGETLNLLTDTVPHYVGDLIKDDPRKTAQLRSDELVSDVLAKLEFEDVGALVVSDDGDKIKGIISERDVVRGMRYYGADVFNLHVAVLMQDNVITCKVSHTVAHAMELMHHHHIRHLPVIDKGKLIGLLSLRDVLPRMFQDDA